MDIDDKRSDSALSRAVAEEIQVLMLRRRITGDRLASELGVSPAWVSYRLNGKVDIKLGELEKIAQVLNAEITDLLPSAKKVERIAYPDRPDRAAPRAKRLILAAPHTRPASTTQGADRADIRRPTIRPYRHSGVPA